MEIPDSMLTEAQRSALSNSNRVKEAKTNVAVISTYAGLGKELGVAINDALSAITEQTNKFANTPLGHLVMFIVIYKVCGKMVVGILFSAVIWVISIILSIGIYFGYVKNHPLPNGDNNNITPKAYWLMYTIGLFLVSLFASAVALF